MIFWLGVIALFVGPARVPIEETRPLQGLNAANALAGNDAFTPEGVFASDKQEVVPRGIGVRGSWLGSDEFQGRHETGWFRSRPRFSLMVAGYPMLPGNRLELESRRIDGTLQRHAFDLHNIGEAWQQWTLEFSPDIEALRILATDATTSAGGWLGFSEPFTSHPIVTAQLWSMFQLATATCLTLTLLCGPGLLWFGARMRGYPRWRSPFSLARCCSRA